MFLVRHVLSFVEQVLCSVRELLVTAKVCVSLLHFKGYLDMIAVVVVHRSHSWVGLCLLYWNILRGIKASKI